MHPGRSVLMLFRLACVLTCLSLPCLSAAQAADSTRPDSAATVRLETVDRESIGNLLGHLTALDDHLEAVGAYSVISARGYFADLLPTGGIASQPALVYSLPGCRGSPFIARKAQSGATAPVPGLVFRAAATSALYFVPAGAGVQSLESGSVLRWTPQGAVCTDEPKVTEAYPLAQNEERITGFRHGYAGPLHLVMHTPGKEPRHEAAAESEQPAFSAAPFDVPPDTPQCAPGCFTPYLGDGVCEKECATSLCGFDRGDCSAGVVEQARAQESQLCAPSCQPGDLGDGFCDARCNVSACAFDKGDCAKPH